jgi:hypothetical protein
MCWKTKKEWHTKIYLISLLIPRSPSTAFTVSTYTIKDKFFAVDGIKKEERSRNEEEKQFKEGRGTTGRNGITAQGAEKPKRKGLNWKEREGLLELGRRGHGNWGKGSLELG